MSLRVEPLGACEGEARLRDGVRVGAGFGLAGFARANGDRWLCRDRFTDAHTRVLEQALVRPGGLVALDQTRFVFTGDRFAEQARFRTRGGPNLHARPIVLPAVLRVGERHHPLGGEAWVALRWVGEARLVLGERTHTARALALEAGQGEARQVQWMVAGVGEVALGPADGPPERWLTGYTAAEGEVLGGLDPALAALAAQPWPGLPSLDPQGGRASEPSGSLL